MAKDLLHGFHNYFESEAIPGALPQGCNNPQKPPLGLYAEQLSGTAFTAPQAENRRSWLYRLHPSVCGSEFEKFSGFKNWQTSGIHVGVVDPNPQRWDPHPLPEKKQDFLAAMMTYVLAGDVRQQSGSAVHVFFANADMKSFFANTDAEMLIVAQNGILNFATEFGNFEITPGEIAVIPRGVKFQVALPQKSARGYVCENYGRFFRLPERGPIGSNGLANARDFQTPNAAFHDTEKKFELITKFSGEFFISELKSHPLDVVAWHGNYYPYKYNLRRFNTIGTVSFDHPDPSIFTVLTSPSEISGTANVDFVIFPERWMVAENTFRPPWYHRNVMSEFMGLIEGVYDAKPDGFFPGGASLHTMMAPHGPDTEAFAAATQAKLKPEFLAQTLAFMFEGRLVYEPTPIALRLKSRQKNYASCWKGLKKNYENR